MQKKVAIIEDEAELAALLEYNLGRQGLLTRVISGCKGAVEQLENWKPDLIILDVNLPKHNGGEVLAQVRGDPAFSLVPVLMLTSSASPADQATASRLGANLYIQKPSDLDAFLGLGKVIASLLADR